MAVSNLSKRPARQRPDRGSGGDRRSGFRLIWDWFAKYSDFPPATRYESSRQRIRSMPATSRISIDGEVLARTPVIAEVAERAIEVMVPLQDRDPSG